MAKEVKQELPKWFNGTVYTDGGDVTNPYSGQAIELNNLELSMYDFVKGAEMALSLGLLHNSMNRENLVGDMRKGLDWFRKNNSEAYYVLLD